MITLARMSFRLFSVYKSCVIFLIGRISLRMWFPQCITECFAFVFRMCLVWFQNAIRIDRILPACCLRKGSLPNAFRNLSEFFQNTANRPRIDRTLSACFPHDSPNVFGKLPSCSRSIQGVRKAYGTQHLQIFIPNAPRTRRMLPERFPYMPYAPRMLPEYFLNTHGRHIRMVDENNFEHAQRIFGATECRSVCTRTGPNSQYAPRTHRMLPEYDPFAPRTFKIPIRKTNGMAAGPV